MNKFAVSPVPPSAAPGSDFATELFQMNGKKIFHMMESISSEGC